MVDWFTLSTMADDLTNTISDAAQSPGEVQTAAGDVVARPLPDLIATDKYLKGQAALSGGKSGWGATRPARAVPPNALGS